MPGHPVIRSLHSPSTRKQVPLGGSRFKGCHGDLLSARCIWPPINLQCSHQDFALGSHSAPLQKNRGPVRMLEGQRVKVTRSSWQMRKKSFVVPCGKIIWARTPKGFLHEVHTRSNTADNIFTIAYDLIANLHRIHVTNKVKGNKSKGFKFFDKCFYSFSRTSKMLGCLNYS